MHTIRAAINGYGRIGRNILRAIYEMGYRDRIEIVAINDLADLASNAYLTKHDTVHGRFSHQVEEADGALCIDHDRIAAFSERDPTKLPWGDLAVDIVFECTGLFASRQKAEAHLVAGAKRVLISAPAGKEVDATIVYGVNEHTLKKEHTIVSNASCTTNCMAPMAFALHASLGIVSGLMNTIHAYTNDQKLIDVYHKDMRRARSATQSMIPTKTGAAAAVGLVIPDLAGKLDGFATRVPTLNVSMVDLTFEAKRSTSIAEINQIMQAAANGPLKAIMCYNEAPLVSVDFNHTAQSCTFDASLTKVCGNIVKVLGWYDNEWGFSNRMIDTTLAWLTVK